MCKRKYVQRHQTRPELQGKNREVIKANEFVPAQFNFNYPSPDTNGASAGLPVKMIPIPSKRVKTSSEKVVFVEAKGREVWNQYLALITRCQRFQWKSLSRRSKPIAPC
jgi:hypothetical protein